jgi:hypothetical protein
VSGVDWTDLNRRKDQWWALENMAMKPGLYTEETQDTFWNGMGMFESTRSVGVY